MSFILQYGLLLGIVFFFLFLPQVKTDAREIIAGVACCLMAVVAFFTVHKRPGESVWLRWGTAGLLVVLIVQCLATNFSIGAWMCRPLLLPHSTENAQAIVVLACGFQKNGAPDFGGMQRFWHAYSLYREKRAPLMIFSTSEVERDGHRQSYWVASLTQTLGLATSSFEMLTKGTDTREEARIIAQHLLPRNLRRILLVTHGPHILRTVKAFEKQGFQVLPAPVQTVENIEETTEARISLFNYAIHEWLGLGLYWVRGDIEFPFNGSSK